MIEPIENLFLSVLQAKDEWDSSFAEALKIEDVDAAIDALDELKTMRDLHIRKMRRALARAHASITHTNTAMLTVDELREHNTIARRFELIQDEIERLLAQWEAQPVMPEDIDGTQP